MKRTHRTKTATITVKCVACSLKWDVRPGEIPAGEQPMCPRCGSPGVPVKARS